MNSDDRSGGIWRSKVGVNSLAGPGVADGGGSDLTGPLDGKRVLITRSVEQAGELAALLSARGAIPLELATVRIAPPIDWGPTDRAIDQLGEYHWVIFTSANGVRQFLARRSAQRADPTPWGGAQVVAIGPATAAALEAQGIRVDLMPPSFVAEALITTMGRFDLAGQRVLLPSAEDAREILPERLAAMGAQVDRVTVYRTLPEGDPLEARRTFAAHEIDIVTLTSPSTVRNLVHLLGEAALDLLGAVVIASIGPITSTTARGLGLTVQVEAVTHTLVGLVAALEASPFLLPKKRPSLSAAPPKDEGLPPSLLSP